MNAAVPAFQQVDLRLTSSSVFDQINNLALHPEAIGQKTDTFRGAKTFGDLGLLGGNKSSWMAGHGVASSSPMLVKLLLVGDSAVGKTSVLMRYVDAEFSLKFMSTIGVDYKDKTTTLDGKQLKLQVWDTAGQERFRTLTASFYRRAHGILLCYDVTDRTSFRNVQEWVREITESAGPHVARVLFGNKCDRVSEKVVSTEEGAAMAAQFDMAFFEGSAKRDENVTEAFEQLARQVKSFVEADRSFSQGGGGDGGGGDASIHLSEKPSRSRKNMKTKNAGCC